MIRKLFLLSSFQRLCFFSLFVYDPCFCTVGTSGSIIIIQFTLVVLDLDLCVMTYLSQIGTDVVLLLPPDLPCVVHYPHPLYIFLLLFVHILLFSLSSYFICRLMHKSCCWSLYCDIYNCVCQPGCFVLGCYRQKTASANTLWHCHPRMQKKVSYRLLEGNPKIFVTVLIADPEHSQVYITSSWSVYQTIKSAIS